MSVSRLGKPASTGLRPVAPRRPSTHSTPLCSSWSPLLTVVRFQPSSCSARYATPSKTSLTARAMNNRLAYPFSERAACCSTLLNLRVSILDIPP